MIKSSIKLLLLLIPFSLNGQDLYHFDTQGIVKDQILDIIQLRYGKEFRYVGFSLIDSIITNFGSEKKHKYQDPYNTLKGCIIFSTYTNQEVNEPDAFIVGVIKNGKIIWDNNPGTHADLGYDLNYCQDINNDGEVDLLFLEDDRETSLNSRGLSLSYLYVFSWNGTSGRFLNTFDHQTGKSSLLTRDYIELLDNDRDGIKEIKASIPYEIDMDFSNYQSKIYPKIIYSWNGKQYGFWPQVKRK